MNGSKSVRFRVATFAPTRSAAAAMRQSASERERRPVALKSSAPFAESTGVIGSMPGNSDSASSLSSSPSGPQRNSAYVIADKPTGSPSAIHVRSFASSSVPARSA